MNTAKLSNLLFLIVVVISAGTSAFLSLLHVNKVDIAIIPNLIASQLIIFVPGMIFYLLYTKHCEFKLFGKIKPVSAFLFIIFAFLIIPLASAVNVFSQLFVKNEVVAMSDKLMGMPFPVMLLIVGILGPASEEFVFRGIIFKGLLNRSGRVLVSAVLSAAFFSLMHMNLNQAMYAFVLGFIFAIINYSLDSIFPSIICHCIVNSENVVLLYVMEGALGSFTSSDIMSEMDMIYNQSIGKVIILIVFVVTMGIAVVTTGLAALLLYAICLNEGKKNRLTGILKKVKNDGNTVKSNVLYVTGIVGMAVCMVAIFVL